ncbi:hypothetical protein [uncultured Helicobacter sp.]
MPSKPSAECKENTESNADLESNPTESKTITQSKSQRIHNTESKRYRI